MYSWYSCTRYRLVAKFAYLIPVIPAIAKLCQPHAWQHPATDLHLHHAQLYHCMPGLAITALAQLSCLIVGRPLQITHWSAAMLLSCQALETSQGYSADHWTLDYLYSTFSHVVQGADMMQWEHGMSTEVSAGPFPRVLSLNGACTCLRGKLRDQLCYSATSQSATPCDELQPGAKY